jgi:putative transposase
MVSFPRPRVRVRGNQILFGKNLMTRGFPTFPLGTLPITRETCVGARLVPYFDRFVLELVYEAYPELFPRSKHPHGMIGIDLGVNNLVATSDGILVKGGVVKSINQWFNKQLAMFRSLAVKHNQRHITHRIQELHRVRANKLMNFLHKGSRFLINHCLQHNISTIVIGYNSGWKQRSQLGTRNNQSFVQIPFLRLVHMLKYKAKLVGIKTILVSEAFTSQKCSSCRLIDKRNRRSRGLFQCYHCGLRLNADHNSARNILKKHEISTQVVPTGEASKIANLSLQDRGCVAHPVSILLN